jgi:Transposase, Mutator family
VRIAPPTPRGEARPGEGDRHGEAHDADCVRIVHKHRNLLAHAPEALHEEVSADYTDMVYAATPQEIEARRKAFLRKWRLKCRAVADSLEEAGERLFSFTRLPPSQWKSARTTDEIDKTFLGPVCYPLLARVTAWRRAGHGGASPVAQPYRRSSFAAPVRPPLPVGRVGCQWLTACS